MGKGPVSVSDIERIIDDYKQHKLSFNSIIHKYGVARWVVKWIVGKVKDAK